MALWRLNSAVKVIGIWLWLFILPSCVFASTNTVQALLTEIASLKVVSEQNEQRLSELFNHSNPDVSVSAKIRLATLFWQSGQLNEAELLLNNISEQLPSYKPKFQVESLLAWASFEFRRNRYPQSEQYARQASELAKSIHQPLIGKSYQLIGSALREQRKTLEAKHYFELALEKHQQANNGLGVFDILNNLGVMYRDSGDLANATKYLLQARELVEQYGGIGDKATAYYNLGDVFRDSNEPQKAIEYYRTALLLDKEIGDLSYVAYDYTGISLSYLALEQYALALENNQKAVEQLLQIDAPQELSRAYLQQSRIFGELGKQDSRLESLLLAEKSAAESESSYQIMSVTIDKAEYDLELQNYSQALEALLGALQVANELSLDIDKLRVNKLLARTYGQLKKYQQAYQHLAFSLDLEEKLNGENRRETSERYKRDLNLLEEQLKVSQLEQKEAEQSQMIEAQRVEKQRLLIIVGAAIVVFLALAVLLIQRRKLAVLKADLLDQSLQQKQQLFADISHELRTPLTVFKLKMEELEYNIADDPKSVYQLLHDRIDGFNHLINDISLLAQNDQGELELNCQPVQLLPFFQLRVEELTALADKYELSVETNLNLSEQEQVNMDSDRIRQVLANLFSNACRYTDAPGVVRIQVGLTNENLEIVLEDSAPNLAPDELEKVFERLYRADKSRSRKLGGSGLGLSICQHLVEAHKGHITATQSALGGLKFTILLPLQIY